MRAVFALVLVVGMALAGVAVYMAQSYMSQSQTALAKAQAYREKTGKLVEVYAVNKELKYGAPLTKDDVVAVYVQEKYLPAGAFRVMKEGEEPAPLPAAAEGEEAPTPVPPLFPEKEDKPRFIMRSLEANEVLLVTRVTEPGQMAGLTGKLDKGMRAFQIKVDVASGVTGFIAPDDLIDIYWTGNGGASVSGDVTRLIESAIRIIAVDQASGEGQMTGSDARTVTVAATPEQVARLAQAQATGRLAMSLVASADDAVEGLVEVDSKKLLGIVDQEVVAVEAPEVCSIKQNKGGEMVDIPIPCKNN